MLIGLVAEAGSGKTTIARYFLDGCGGLVDRRHVERYSFAGPLKSILKIYFRANVYDKVEMNPLWGMTTREMLQRMGDGMRDWFGEDVWIKLLDQDLRWREVNESVIIDDVRYVNEAEYIKNNGHLIRLKCIDLEKIKESSHKSERDMHNIPEDWFFATVAYSKSDGPNTMNKRFREVVQKILDTDSGLG